MFSAYVTALPPSSLPPGPGLVAAVDAHVVLGALALALAVGAALLVRACRRGPAPRRLEIVERAASARSRAA
jgi:hypothetical protein